MNPQETLVEYDETRNMLDGVRREIMKLNSVHVQKCTEEGMQGKRKTSGEVVRKNDAFIRFRMRHLFELSRLVMATGVL